MTTKPTREELALLIDDADWSCLRAHLQRGSLIVVAADLDLSNVAMCVAGDDSTSISHWTNNGKLMKPTETQIRDWDADPAKIFSMLITSPYILMQEHPAIFQ